MTDVVEIGSGNSANIVISDAAAAEVSVVNDTPPIAVTDVLIPGTPGAPGAPGAKGDLGSYLKMPYIPSMADVSAWASGGTSDIVTAPAAIIVPVPVAPFTVQDIVVQCTAAGVAGDVINVAVYDSNVNNGTPSIPINSISYNASVTGAMVVPVGIKLTGPFIWVAVNKPSTASTGLRVSQLGRGIGGVAAAFRATGHTVLNELNPAPASSNAMDVNGNWATNPVLSLMGHAWNKYFGVAVRYV